MNQFVVQTINGLTLAGIMFLVSSGFTLVFGVMRITNLAHGAIYLLGGYIAYSTIQLAGNFFVGLVAAGLSMAVLGVVLERTLIKRMRGQVMAELLATLGLVYVMMRRARRRCKVYPCPNALSGHRLQEDPEKTSLR